MLILDTENK